MRCGASFHIIFCVQAPVRRSRSSPAVPDLGCGSIKRIPSRSRTNERRGRTVLFPSIIGSSATSLLLWSRAPSPPDPGETGPALGEPRAGADSGSILWAGTDQAAFGIVPRDRVKLKAEN